MIWDPDIIIQMTGERIKRICFDRRIHQAAAAQEIGISKSTLSRWLNGGKDPSTPAFLRACGWIEMYRAQPHAEE